MTSWERASPRQAAAPPAPWREGRRGAQPSPAGTGCPPPLACVGPWVRILWWEDRASAGLPVRVTSVGTHNVTCALAGPSPVPGLAAQAAHRRPRPSLQGLAPSPFGKGCRVFGSQLRKFLRPLPVSREGDQEKRGSDPFLITRQLQVVSEGLAVVPQDAGGA